MENTNNHQRIARSDKGQSSISAAGIVQIFGSAKDALFAQADLHHQLVKIEWEEEKQRLSRMFTALLVGFSCFICLLIFLGILAIALAWNTEYQWISILGLCIVYGLVAYVAWKKFMTEVKRPERFFQGSREEIAADLAMIKSKLE